MRRANRLTSIRFNVYFIIIFLHIKEGWEFPIYIFNDYLLFFHFFYEYSSTVDGCVCCLRLFHFWFFHLKQLSSLPGEESQLELLLGHITSPYVVSVSILNFKLTYVRQLWYHKLIWPNWVTYSSVFKDGGTVQTM